MSFGNRQSTGLPLEGGTMSGAINMGTNNITNCADITAANANGYALINGAGSATVPNIRPDRASTTLGFSAVGASVAAYVIANSTQQQNWQNGTTVIGTTTTLDLRGAWIADLAYAGNDADVAGARGRLRMNVTPSGSIAGGATFDITGAIPAGAMVLGVSARVTTAITGCVTWDMGIAGATTRFGTGLALAQGTTTDNTNLLANTTAQVYTTATAIRLSAIGGAASFSAGAVRVAVLYWDTTAPTS